MRTLLIIGIGMGNPDHLTVQAIEALNQVDVFFVIDKGEATRELVDLRTAICAQHIQGTGYRVVEIPDVDRDRDGAGYREAVVDWHERRAARCEQAILDELGEDGCGGLLVWGDMPSPRMLAGAALIMGAGLYIVLRERALAR